MRTTLLRSLLALLAAIFSALSFAAGTITVTSPTANDYLGKTASVTFNITGASVKVTVHAVITAPDGTTSSPPDAEVTPGTDGKGSGSISLTFGDATPEGSYSIQVTATEPGNTYNTPPVIPVTVDHTAPIFLELSPVNGGYTRGIVHIRASVEEANVKSYRVQVNSQDIPNGAGTGNDISVDYDPTNIKTDQALSISIVVTDQANNSTTKTISVTLDRIAPDVQILYPQTTTKFSSKQDVSVQISIDDHGSTSSVDRTGIDVVAKKNDGAYIARVTFVSLTSASGKLTWVGRIRYVKGLLPSSFKISVNVIDRAGNVANLQEVTVQYKN